MAYRRFSLQQLRKEFQINNKVDHLFDKPSIAVLPLGEYLKYTLNKAKSLRVRSEKAKSELIVMPMLMDLMDKNKDFLTVYSGESLIVDKERGLSGECDFILAKNNDSFDISAPIMMLVEAKRHDLEGAVPQCVAQMLGARLYNERMGQPIPIIYGCVTNADDWLFMQLSDKLVRIDQEKYYLKEIDKVLGIFQHIIDQYKTT